MTGCVADGIERSEPIGNPPRGGAKGGGPILLAHGKAKVRRFHDPGMAIEAKGVEFGVGEF
jgi:hypothetical protein